jgi:putative ABC transport system substrate-binding protein
MRRRKFLGVLGGTVLFWPRAGSGQSRDRTRRVGYLRASPPPSREFDALKRGLAEHGYADGLNLVVVPAWGDGNTGRLPELAASLIAKNVDVIVAEGSLSVRAASDASPTVAIVMTRIGDPFGLVSSLSRPGGNITGVSTQGVDITSKMLEILKVLVPSLSRVALLGPPVARSMFGLATD